MKLITSLFAAVLLMTGCSNTDDILNNQLTLINNYISNNYPELITEDGELAEGVYRNGIFKIPVLVSGDTRLIESGDSVYFFFQAHILPNASTQPSINTTYYSNIRGVISDMRETGLNTGLWKVGPTGILLGKDEIVKGLELALPGSRQGDRFVVIMPSELGYDSRQNGSVYENSILLWEVKIDRVVK